jgi:Phosphoribosylanthranilate isomerase
MVNIKICGLRRLVDIEYVNKLMPEYVGFVFAKSKRIVSLAEAELLIKKLNKNIKTVGVFVNEDKQKVMQIAKQLDLKVLQFHGEEDNEYFKGFEDFEIWKAVGIKDEKDIYNLRGYNCDGILLDSKVDGISGGNGKTFDWKLIDNFKLQCKLILAGGLNIENVSTAIKMAIPYAVDVSSGVESEGFKDYDKIKKFIEKVRENQ